MVKYLPHAAAILLAVFLVACEDITIPDPPGGGGNGGGNGGNEEATALTFTGLVVNTRGVNVALPENHHIVVAWTDGRGVSKIGRAPELSTDRKSYTVTFGPEDLTKDHFYDPLDDGSGVGVARILSVTPQLGEGIMIGDRQLLPNMTTGAVDLNVVFKLHSEFDSQNDQGWASNFERGYSLALPSVFNSWEPTSPLTTIDSRLHLK